MWKIKDICLARRCVLIFVILTSCEILYIYFKLCFHILVAVRGFIASLYAHFSPLLMSACIALCKIYENEYVLT